MSSPACVIAPPMPVSLNGPNQMIGSLNSGPGMQMGPGGPVGLDPAFMAAAMGPLVGGGPHMHHPGLVSPPGHNGSTPALPPHLQQFGGYPLGNGGTPVNGSVVGRSSPLTDQQLERPSSTDENLLQMLTIRMLMSGKEVGSIIGKKGDNVKKYRVESGARINISDGSCPERIVTVTGTVDQIFAAFNLMCQKFEDDFTQNLGQSEDDVSCPPVTLRLLVPATQCGSIIGKGGCKIKDIRELTGASIQVASEVLPNSSERTVTISGTAKAIAKCIRQLCHILLDTPPKGATIPYRPKPALPPGIGLNQSPHQIMPGTQLSQDQMSPEPLNYPLIEFTPFTSADMPYQLPPSLPQTPLPPGVPMMPMRGPLPHLFNPDTAAAMLAGSGMPSLIGHPLGPPLRCAPLGPHGMPPPHLPPCPPPPPGLATLFSDGPPGSNGASGTVQYELIISNDLIGCIIGRGGHKINEIRHQTGAQIKISNCEENSRDRKITICGTQDTVYAAFQSINNSVELHKQLTTLNLMVHLQQQQQHQQQQQMNQLPQHPGPPTSPGASWLTAPPPGFQQLRPGTLPGGPGWDSLMFEHAMLLASMGSNPLQFGPPPPSIQSIANTMPTTTTMSLPPLVVSSQSPGDQHFNQQQQLTTKLKLSGAKISPRHKFTPY